MNPLNSPALWPLQAYCAVSCWYASVVSTVRASCSTAESVRTASPKASPPSAAFSPSIANFPPLPSLLAASFGSLSVPGAESIGVTPPSSPRPVMLSVPDSELLVGASATLLICTTPPSVALGPSTPLLGCPTPPSVALPSVTPTGVPESSATPPSTPRLFPSTPWLGTTPAPPSNPVPPSTPLWFGPVSLTPPSLDAPDARLASVSAASVCGAPGIGILLSTVTPLHPPSDAAIPPTRRYLPNFGL